jgi:hypothetical protein
LLTDSILYGTGTLAIAGCGFAVYQGEGWSSVLLAGALGLLSGGFLKYRFIRIKEGMNQEDRHG